MSKPIDIEVKAKLELRRGDWLTISQQAGISHSWISKFVNGHIPNPGYATLRNLAAYLSDKDETRSGVDRRKSRAKQA